MSSQFRYNKLYKEWILFAPNRAKRPVAKISLEPIYATDCPFDKGNENLTPKEILRLGDDDNWRCRVIPNLYNALNIEDDITSSKVGCFETKSGFGVHEVIIETPHHNRYMFNYSVDEFFDYFNIIKLRLYDLKKDIRLNYFSLFKNHGVEAGASQSHSHSQLIATPFIPTNIKNDLNFYKQYKLDNDRDFFDDIISDEKSKTINTILFENSSFIAIHPFASKYPFEILIISKQNNISSIIKCDDKEIYALSELSNFIFNKLYKALGNISFNMVFKNGDLQNSNNSNRFHIIITPRLYKTAGFEIDTDIFINTFLPEDATKILLKTKEER